MLTLSSCATLFNSKRSRLRIIADEPKEISFDKDTLNKFRTENQLDPNRDKSLQNDNPNEKHSNILKITPLKITGFVNPSIEISHETRTGKNFSTQFMASYLLPSSLWNLGTGINPGVKGLRVAVEEKFYFKRSAPLGRYVSVEFNYLKNQYKEVKGGKDSEHVQHGKLIFQYGVTYPWCKLCASTLIQGTVQNFNTLKKNQKISSNGQQPPLYPIDLLHCNGLDCKRAFLQSTEPGSPTRTNRCQNFRRDLCQATDACDWTCRNRHGQLDFE